MHHSIPQTPSQVKTLVACLLSFMLFITPITALAATAGNSPTVKRGVPNAKDAKTAESELFVNQPVEMPALPAAQPEPAPEPPAPFAPVVGAVTATKTAALTVTANNGDSKADPGDTINYTVQLSNTSGSDGSGITFSDTIDTHTTLSGTVNSTPVAFDQTGVAAVVTNEDTGVSITLQGQDPDGSNLTFTNISSPANGALGVFSAPSCVSGICSSTATYTPNANFSGSDSFTFKVNDGTSPSNETGTVSITVNAVNDAPTFTVPGNPSATNEDAGAISVSSFITAVRPAQVGNTTEDSQTVSFVITNNTNPSLFSSGPALNVAAPAGPFPTTATLTYTSALNQNGTATITYHAHDNGGTANSGVDNSADQTFTITVNAVNDPPVVVGPAAFAAQANMKRTGLTGLLGNVNDNADNGVNGCVSTSFTVTNVSATSPAGGNVTITNASTGTFDFDPPPGVTGTVTFTYTVTDTGCPGPGVASSPATTVTVNVAGPVIWFVNLGAVSNGDGRLSSPFNLLSSANTKLQSLGANERIFLYSTTATTTAAINDVANLQSTQGLIGQGAIAADFDTLFGITPPAGTIGRPSVNGTRPTVRGTVTLRNNTVVRGVNIDVSAAAAGSKGLTSSGFTSGTSTISDVNVTSTTANAVDFSGTQTITYTTSNASTSPNILSSTTGTALSVVNTTIGAAGLTFRSISSNGAARGILLNTTGGSGGLTVTGNGGTCTEADTTGCSGGTIQNGTGADDSSTTPVGTGIVLNSTSSVSLTRMFIHDHSNYGIRGTSVAGFTLDSSVLNGINGTDTAASASSPFNEGTIKFDNLTGSATVSNTTISGGISNNVRVDNTSGTLNRITFSNDTIGSNSTNNGEDGILLESESAGTVKATIQNTTFTSARGDLFNFVDNATSGTTDDLIFNNNTLSNNHPAIATGGGGTTISSNGTKDFTFHMEGNSFRDAVGIGVLLVKSTGTSSYSGTFTANTIGVAAVANSGSAEGSSLKVQSAGQGTVTVAITNNQIHQYNNNGIELLTGGGASAQSGTFNATITGNTIDTPGNTSGTISIPKNGIHLNGGTVPGDTYAICTQIGGAGALANSVATGGKDAVPPTIGDIDIRLRQRQATTVRLPGYGGANNDNTAVQNFLIANNSGNGAPVTLAANTVPTGGGYIGGAACTAPTTRNMRERSTEHDHFARLANSLASINPNSLFAFSNTRTYSAFFIDQINNLRHPETEEAATNTLASPIVAKVEGGIQQLEAGRQETAGKQQTAYSKPTTHIESKNRTIVEARSQKSEVREEPAALYARAATPNTSVNNRGEVKLNHARSLRRKQANAAAMAPVFAPVPPPPGTIMINGVGSGFQLPNSKTITIKFSVTLNNPPNLSGVPPATPQISNQGTLSGVFAGNPIVTDNPATGAANDATVTLVDLFNTTTTLSPASGNLNSGQSITFTALVAFDGATAPAPAGGTAPSGTVDFFDNGSVTPISGCAAVALTGPVGTRTAQCTTSFSTGSHSVTSHYNGDGNFDPSTSSASVQAVGQSGTTTVVTSSQNPANVGQNVTYTGTVTSTTTFAGPPTGTVTFSDNGTPITCTNGGTSVQTLSSGVATCQTSYANTTGSPHTITGVYSGDGNFTGSNNTGSPLIQIVSSSLSMIVNTLGDAGDLSLDGVCDSDAAAGNQCTLRAAIQEANSAATDDSITFDPALNGGTITLDTALDAISGNLTITGPGATLLTVRRNPAAATNFRIFTINSGTTVTISGLTISGGNMGPGAATLGGGISNSGTLTLTNNVVSGNTAGGAGGGVTNAGTLSLNGTTISGNTANSGAGIYSNVLNSGTVAVTINNSTISGNNGNGLGAGIFNGAGSGTAQATLAINNSTISGNINAGSSGGGIYNAAVFGNAAATVTINNSTISGNSAGSGGGVYHVSSGSGSTATATLTNCTITANNSGSASDSGGGIFTTIFNSISTLTLRNTLVAGNLRSSGTIASDVSAAVDPASLNNLIGDGTGMTGISQGSGGNQVGTAGAPINPRLAALANNGGPTRTHALLAGSPALDAGNNTSATNAGLFTDQRGGIFSRIVDGPDADQTDTVDIGAFEAQVSLPDLADQAISEDGSLSLPFNVGGGAGIVSVTATSSNTTLVPNVAGNIDVTGSGSSRTLVINPVANAFGTSTITVTVTGANSQTMADTFLLTVNSVNDTPSFTKGGDQNVAEDAGAQSISGWATAISAGPANESSQTLTFLVTNNTNSALFSVQPAVSSTGTLTYTPAANTSGTAAITIVLMDNGGGADTSAPQTFNITVNSINDPPVNAVPGAQSMAENSSLTFSAANSNAISIADIDAGTNAVRMQLTATNGVITLSSISGLSFTAGDGTADATMTFTGTIGNINAALNGLVFIPTAGFSGAASLQIVTNDQGNTGSGGALSDTDTVNITVNDGGTLQFSAASYNVSESVGNATITVTRTGGTAGTATVQFSTSNGTATAGSDYTAVTNQTVTFNNGDTSKTVAIPITNDSLDENDETVNLTLTNAGGSGALGSPASAVLTINDDDPTPSLSINDVSLAEGNSGTTLFRFTVTLSAASALPVTVNYATANGTADSSDYTAVPITLLTFNPGDTSKSVDVLVNGDILSEGNDTFFVNLTSPTNATISDNQGLGTIVDDDAIGGTIVFSSATYTVNEDAGSVQITVNRMGTTTQAVSVDYATSDITATERKDYTTALGTLKFAPGETSKTFTVLVNQDSFSEGSELLALTLSNPQGGATLTVPQNATLQINEVQWVGPPANPIDNAGFFVREHYHDFLNREPDAAGLAFWTNQITGCGSDTACIELKRINVSAAFFLSIEFQETGFSAYLTNKVAFGSPLPRYRDFVRDTQALGRDFVFGAPGADAVLEANKVAFFNDFVNRSDFVAIYGALTNAAYVDALIAHTGVSFTTAERDALVSGLNGATETRATVLRKITEKASFKAAEFNRAFVMMEYFGYLRRNADDPPDNNLNGFNFWLNKLNQFNGNFINADMVKAFIISAEYRERFGN